MKAALMVDYAGLYHVAWEEANGSLPSNRHNETFEILGKLERYLATHDTRVLRGTQIVVRHVFLLDRGPFRSAAETARQLGWGVTLSPWRRRTASEAVRNFSADDDTELKQLVTKLLPQLDAVVLVARDSDFISLIDMVRHAGRVAVVAAYETPQRRLPRIVADHADLVLPLHDIAAEQEDPEPLPPLPQQEAMNSEVNATPPPPGEPLVELHYNGRWLGNYPLRFAEMEIGRSSKRLGHFPQVDLASYDSKKATSRRHILIRRACGKRLLLQVHSACSQGTWLNGDPLFPGENIQVQDGDQIVLGNGSGENFGLLLRLPAAEQTLNEDRNVL